MNPTPLTPQEKAAEILHKNIFFSGSPTEWIAAQDAIAEGLSSEYRRGLMSAREALLEASKDCALRRIVFNDLIALSAIDKLLEGEGEEQV